jgi:WD40 repeat protein
VISRWTLSGEPRSLAFGPDGTLYAGLRKPQSVVAIDLARGAVLKEVVLDSEEIASTKDFATMRYDAKRKRLVIAQGSDESVSILAIPSLAVEREILLEGEMIRDAIPDPQGRYLYILGRSVHVRDADGNRQIRIFSQLEPTAIAVSSDGKWLAIVGTEKVDGTAATAVSLIDTERLEESRRELLQTDRRIESALFANRNQALIVFADDWLAEKRLAVSAGQAMKPRGEAMQVTMGRDDFLSTESICLPAERGPQVAIVSPQDNMVWFAERRCSSAGSVIAAPRTVATSSLYGAEVRALAWDPVNQKLAGTDGEETITLYHPPKETQPPAR